MNEVINACCITISVTNTKMSICKNQCITNSMMQYSFEDNVRICQSTLIWVGFLGVRF